MTTFEAGEKLRIETVDDGVYTGIIESVEEMHIYFQDKDLILTFFRDTPKFLIGMETKAIRVESVERVSSFD